MKTLSFSLLCVLGATALAIPYQRTFLGHAPASIGLVYAQGNEDENILPPQLERVATCESGNKHFDSKGRVLTHVNKDGSKDVGYLQINLSVWDKTAKIMGLDLKKEEDNKKFGVWLYIHQGVSPWSASRKCQDAL